jgi:transcriptional repressor NrdR
VVGNLIMRELRKVDPVAYVRFASVYREFRDLEEFENVTEELRKRPPRKRPPRPDAEGEREAGEP